MGKGSAARWENVQVRISRASSGPARRVFAARPAAARTGRDSFRRAGNRRRHAPGDGAGAPQRLTTDPDDETADRIKTRLPGIRYILDEVVSRAVV